MAYNTSKLDKLIKKRNGVVMKLEKAYMAKAKSNKVPSKEPSVRLGFCGLWGKEVCGCTVYSAATGHLRLGKCMLQN